MFNISEDIHSLTDFKRHTANFVKQIKKHRRPMVLTVNGKAAFIVQDASSYQKLIEIVDEFEARAAIQKGVADSKKGNLVSLEKFDQQMRKKNGIQGS